MSGAPESRAASAADLLESQYRLQGYSDYHCNCRDVKPRAGSAAGAWPLVRCRVIEFGGNFGPCRAAGPAAAMEASCRWAQVAGRAASGFPRNLKS